MPSLSQLITTLPPVIANADAFLRHFVDTPQPSPTPQALGRFIDLAKNHCRTRPQQTAILQLSRLGLVGGACAFRHIDRTLLTYQMIRRIMQPGLFEQGGFGLCGPAAFAVAACRDDPVAFARFATHLLETGRGTLKGRQIAPARQVLDFDPGQGGVGAADFLILASVRDSREALTPQTDFARYDGTGLGWMFDWFVQAGYPRVLMVMTPPEEGLVLKVAYTWARTFQKDQYVLRCHPDTPGAFGVSGLKLDNKREILKLACAYTQMDWKVMLSGTTGIGRGAQTGQQADSMAQDPQMPAQIVTQMRQQAANQLRGGEQHWLIAEHLDVQGPNVDVRVWTWGNTFTATALPLADFLPAFGGFVAACPVPTNPRAAIHDPF